MLNFNEVIEDTFALGGGDTAQRIDHMPVESGKETKAVLCWEVHDSISLAWIAVPTKCVLRMNRKASGFATQRDRIFFVVWVGVAFVHRDVKSALLKLMRRRQSG